MKIKEVKARKIKDSRGDWTIEIYVNGCSASSPNGKSTGKFETKPYMKSLDFCIDFINKNNWNMNVNKFDDLKKFEKELAKKIKKKSAREFGANALFAFECAILKAVAKEEGKELWQAINPKAKKFPYPVGNAIGGGLHSIKNKVRPNFQEFLVIPQSKSFFDNVKIMNYVYSEAGKVLQSKEKNDEGAWLVENDNKEVLDLLNYLRKKAEMKFGVKIGLGIDVAASTFYKNGKYNYHNIKLDNKEQLRFMQEIIYNYDLFYLEDGLEQGDWNGFIELTKKSNGCLIVGDDFIATQISRLKKAIKMKAVSAVIVKPNQNGSLIELKEIFGICKKHGIKTVMSHRSGETTDNALADLAFGFGADFIKCGISGKEREIKLYRLRKIEIENQLK